MTKKKKQSSTPVVIAAIVGLVILECVALLNGLNGTMFSIVIALIAGLGGYMIPSPIKK